MSPYHPNIHTPGEFIEHGLMAASNAFRSCGMEALYPPADEFGCDSFLYGELGSLRFLVYVRVTCNDEPDPVDDTPPGVLIDAARQLEAEPHLIDVHVTRQGGGHGFGYRGYDEFIRAVRSNEGEWNLAVLQGKTVGDYLRLKSGRLSKLEIHLDREKGGEGECIALGLVIDGNKPYDGTICPYALLDSTMGSGECDIFTCSCGVPGCADIGRGVVVVNDGCHTLWKAYYARPSKIFVFDRREYVSEIIRKCSQAIGMVRSGEVAGIVPWEGRMAPLEKMLYEATEHPAGDASAHRT